MAEYIEREAVVELFNKWADGYSYIEVPTKDAVACVRAVPAADVRPLVRGAWRGIGKTGRIFVCSACDKTFPYKTRCCPNCGADMGEK
jgi:hypothetical protein